MKETTFSYREAPGRANYFACRKEGFLATRNIGADSANLITVGPAANALNKHEPAFRLAAAHELGHVFHNNTAHYARSNAHKSVGKQEDWVVEGSIDALAVWHTRDHYGRE